VSSHRPRLTPLLLAVTLACAGETGDASSDDTGPVEDPSDPCKLGYPPSLQIGQGELEFVPLADGEMIELIHGPQGGVHTLMGLVATGIDASDDADAEFRGYLDGVQVGGSFPYLSFRCKRDEGQQVWGVFLFWDFPPEQLHMQPVHIEVDVTDASGQTLSASKEAIIYDPTL
jgi:hypothetical protein